MEINLETLNEKGFKFDQQDDYYKVFKKSKLFARIEKQTGKLSFLIKDYDGYLVLKIETVKELDLVIRVIQSLS